jgi:signal peptidase
MKQKTMQKIFWSIGVVLCVVLIPVLIMNVTMIVKSYLHPDKVPDFLGYKPFIVLSGSMEPTIKSGDVAIIKEIDPKVLKVNDVIAFKTGDVVVTHRITDVKNTKDGIAYITKGDNNNGIDNKEVLPKDVEGIYLSRIGGIGNFALFLQTPIGLLLFVVTPLVLFIIYDVIWKIISGKKRKTREQELEEELAKLKAKSDNDETEAM